MDPRWCAPDRPPGGGSPDWLPDGGPQIVYQMRAPDWLLDRHLRWGAIDALPDGAYQSGSPIGCPDCLLEVAPQIAATSRRHYHKDGTPNSLPD